LDNEVLSVEYQGFLLEFVLIGEESKERNGININIDTEI